MDTETSDECQPSPYPSYVSHDNLEAIDGAIERLNHTGIAIRSSPATSHVTKARIFTEKFESTTFEAVADSALKSLYPDASLGLLELLTRAMTETYAHYRYRQSRQEQLQKPRAGLRKPVQLSTIDEEPTTNANDGGFLNNEMQTSHHGKSSTIGKPQPTSQPPPVLTVLRSEPTSLNSREFQMKLQKQGKSAKSRTRSIQVNQIDYPQPPKGSLTCEWCFGPLPKDVFEREKWK